MTTIPAAGTLPWRRRDGVLEVALVHRPRYDDWSWAKGKLDDGELWPVAAARETREETGLLVRLGRPLPDARYTVLGRDGAPDTKVVRYWSAQPRESGKPTHSGEVDEVAWLDVQVAFDRLDYSRDRDQLLALIRDDQAGRLDTWPLLVVRHAKAVARSDYRGKDDRLRPLDAKGVRRAAGLTPLLAAYAPDRIITSPSTRCVQTVAPYAAHAPLRLRERLALSEEGFAADPTKAPALMRRVLERGIPTAVCSHGPVLPTLLDVLTDRLDLGGPDSVSVVETLAEARDDKLVKGETLVCHVAGTGEAARVVAVERHLP